MVNCHEKARGGANRNLHELPAELIVTAARFDLACDVGEAVIRSCPRLGLVKHRSRAAAIDGFAEVVERFLNDIAHLHISLPHSPELPRRP